MTGKRPNVLVLMTDQHVAHQLGCAGGDVATPNLDRLAAGGTRFTRAYTTFPLCVPARASLVTGRYPHEIGIDGNSRESAAPEPGRATDSLGHLVGAAGYDCAYAGKWHARQPSASAADGFTVLHPFGDAGLGSACADWLRGRAGQDRPFLLFASFDDPHTICEYARDQPLPYGDVPRVPVRQTPNLPANYGHHPYEPEALRHEQDVQAAVYGVARYTPDDWRQYRYAYARLVERVDARLGEVLDALDANGLTDDTVVVFTSDHGDGDAAHAWNQKSALFEEVVRVPLVVRWPGRVGAGAVSDTLVSIGLDLLPTLCAVTGARTPDGLAGRDLVSALDPVPIPGPDHVVVETRFGRAVIGPRYKYVVYSWGRCREQLFDVVDDPGEICNLAVVARHGDVLEQHRAHLLDWCLRTVDTTFLKRLVLPEPADESVRAHIFVTAY